MALFHHTIAALRLNLGSVVAHPRHAMLIAAGLLIASFTLLVVLTIPAGLHRIAGHTGRADVAVVLSGDGYDETFGNISPDLIKRISVLPGVATGRDGTPMLAPQFVVTTKLQRRDGAKVTVLVRGVSPAFWAVVGDAVRIKHGQPPEPGLPQVVSGAIASELYPYTRAGDSLQLKPRSFASWQVSGEFAAGHGLWESELWADLESLRGEYNAPGQTTTAWVRLTAPSAFDGFASAMHADPRLRGLKVLHQSDFYQVRVAFLGQLVRAASLAIAVLLGVMAILACNSAVGLALRARRRELAMLRAIGFGNGALFAALLAEVLVLALLCALAAAGIATLLLHSTAVDSSSGNASIRFVMAVTSGVVGMTLAYAGLLGLTASVVPAWRALHAPLVKALARE